MSDNGIGKYMPFASFYLTRIFPLIARFALNCSYLSISGKLAEVKIIKKIIVENQNCNISPNTQHMALGQVSNGSDELLEQYGHGPRGKKKNKK
jgi:hypothetical protein